MGLMTTALLLGAGSAAYGAVNARKERKDAQREMDRNTTMARENARLDQTKEATGAEIVLGTDGAGDNTKTKRKATPRKTTTTVPTVGTTIGRALVPSLGTAVGLR